MDAVEELPVPPPKQSPFFHIGHTTGVGDLAVLHLKKDSLLPVTLSADANEEYAEGPVTNTRFGSFPHSTLIGLQWGSQVRASKVDTGSKGRKKSKQASPAESDAIPKESLSPNKRKAEADAPEPAAKKVKQAPSQSPAAESLVPERPALEAGSGFIHILSPTPESWTSSLSHRTQVVYTPDYSYILQRLRVRPGNSIIEAGAGSGSFTHAAARAVFNGYSDPTKAPNRKLGRVYSFEYHQPRVETLREELDAHGLADIVHLTHRDVCNEGFILDSPDSLPAADAVFLDLPAPWLALRHLSRASPNSPLNQKNAIQLCTFSPCIEQVTATISTLRKTGWTEIRMTEIANRRIDVRREQIGVKNEGLHGVNTSAATVEEAIGRLREVESKFSEFHSGKKEAAGGWEKKVQSKAERLAQIKIDLQSRKLYKEGLLVHRTEPEVKTHTSYLVFATLPRVWSEEDERACVKKWPV